jgi:uncharacterized membrane protein YccC
VSFNTRRILALAIVLVAAIFGGLLGLAYFASRLAPLLGVVIGAVVGLVFVWIWASRSL